MHAIKKKLWHELEKIEHEEMAKAGDMYADNLTKIDRITETLYRLHKLEKMKEGHDGEYQVEIKDKNKLL